MKEIGAANIIHQPSLQLYNRFAHIPQNNRNIILNISIQAYLYSYISTFLSTEMQKAKQDTFENSTGFPYMAKLQTDCI